MLRLHAEQRQRRDGTGPVVSSVSHSWKRAFCRRLKAADAAARKLARGVRVSMSFSLARIDAGLKDRPLTRLNHKLRVPAASVPLAGALQRGLYYKLYVQRLTRSLFTKLLAARASQRWTATRGPHEPRAIGRQRERPLKLRHQCRPQRTEDGVQWQTSRRTKPRIKAR